MDFPPDATGDRIRQYRGRYRVSQGRLAECLGVSRQAVYLWESGRPIEHPRLVAWALRAMQEPLKREPPPERKKPARKPIPPQLRARQEQSAA
jgi:transcriptional regulator with XRE-family HTH domain